VCYHNTIELSKNNFDVNVYTSESKYLDDSFSYGGDFLVTRLKPLFRIGNAPFIYDLMKINDFDIIHLHLPFFFGDMLTLFNNILNKIPYVVTYHHDPIFDNVLNEFSKIYLNFVTKKVLKKAQSVFVTSYDYAYNCMFGDFFNNNEKVKLLPNGVDLEAFDKYASYHVPELNSDAFNILFVGGLDPPHYFKGLNFLLEAVAVLENEEIILTIVGEGELKEHFIKKASTLGISKKTHFKGRVSNQDLLCYYFSSDLLVLPSIAQNEAFGMVLIEAMAASKPVIASNLPGVRSVVKDGYNGFITEPADTKDLVKKISLLQSNSDLRQQMGMNGRFEVEQKYNWANIGLKLSQYLVNAI
jgi:glycosyltransferase involved in cell wall biosynthesis